MISGFDLVQDQLREPRYSWHMSRGETASRTTLPYEIHQFLTEERKARDREWFGSAEADTEIAKKKYRNKYVYIANQRIAGYGRTMGEAGEMARRRTGITPSEMIQVIIPLCEMDF